MQTLFSLSRNALIVAAVLMAAVTTHAQTQRPAPLRSLEVAIETSTQDVSLPSSTSGVLTLRKCQAPCSNDSLQFTSESRFFVGGTQVSYQDFRAYIAQSGSQFLMVFHKPNEPIITRMLVFGQL